jgi:two-component system, LytTR family, sensor histidine kinase AlgZ
MTPARPPVTGAGALPPLWLPLVAAVPVGVCLVIMALPVLGNGQATAFRALFLVLFALWSLPLTVLQRWLWRRNTTWPLVGLVLLATTLGMALSSNVVVAMVAYWMDAAPAPTWAVTTLLRGRAVDGLWLALVASCAIHAVVNHAAALQVERTRLAEVTRLVREADLRALRYQLQPHFLFNTLNSISSLVAMGEGVQARAMIATLGRFLRSTLDADDRDEVSVADELALTETYLEIEQQRLGERLDIAVEVGPAALGARLPRLLLQPLVENAIRHGIAPEPRGGRLALGLWREGARLRVSVVNDQLDPERPAAHAASIDVPRERWGVGLTNTYTRLATLYPDAHTLQATRAGTGRFEVAITIPWDVAAP